MKIVAKNQDTRVAQKEGLHVEAAPGALISTLDALEGVNRRWKRTSTRQSLCLGSAPGVIELTRASIRPGRTEYNRPFVFKLDRLIRFGGGPILIINKGLD